MFEIESPLQIVYARLNRAVLLANFLATVHHDNEANGLREGSKRAVFTTCSNGSGQ